MRLGEVLGGRFRITGGPKRGGMASVWQAEDLLTGETVAVKVLGRDLWGDDSAARTGQVEAYGRFERERDLMARLSGLGVPRLIFHNFLGGDPYLVMEHVSGKNLREFLSKNRPPVVASAAIGVQLLETLSQVHRLGIVHRDLKPANVLLSDEGLVYLIDFGIALPTDPDATRYTKHGPTPGSIGYKAPELIRGVKHPTPAADLYGFACMMFEFVTTRQVFSDLADRSIEDQHRNDPPPRLDPVRHSIPVELADLVNAMLVKDPADRPGVDAGLEVLRGLLPKPGDAEPSPRLHPDPTAIFRQGRPERAPAVPAAPADRRRPVVRRPPRPSRSEFARLLSAAEREMAVSEPSSETRQVVAELNTVTQAWGPGDKLVVRAQLCCADYARIEGDWPGAGSLYRTVERTLRNTTEEEEKGFLLEARVGVAECTLPADDDVTAAFRTWQDVVTEVWAMPRPPVRVVRRCREFAVELSERGCAAEAEALPADE
uniref:serine/threonine-protein kinase n=1 Tax=Herbidospora sakaeratensis TaxID=564415 RepID=UPI0012FA2F4F|nr:serine/threonine-protein kinase [Herbidospora sakaeratensis]